MEAAINTLFGTPKPAQSGVSSLAGDLFAIDSGKSSAKTGAENSFSSMLKEKMDGKEAQGSERERNELPAGGKDDSSVQEKRSETAIEQKEQQAKERQEKSEESAEQQAADKRSDERDSEKSSSKESEQQVDGEADEELVPEPLLAGEEPVLEEGLLNLQQPVVEAQSEMVAPQVAAAQQVVSEEPVEVDEALLEEERLLKAARGEERGRSPNLPPELQRSSQQIQMSEEASFKNAMNILKEQQAAGALAAEMAQAGDASEVKGSNFNLMSGLDPFTSAERPTQLKGMTVPPQSRQWSSELGDRILFMAGKKIQSAEIRLNPPNLGLMEVKLAINGDQAQLVFQSGNAAVRDALESSIPRIREMLEQSGITLADVNISDRQQPGSEQSADKGGEEGKNSPLMGSGEGVEEEVVSISTMAVDRIGLVDYYI